MNRRSSTPLILLILLILQALTAVAQNKRPKIGLVLSGGGAKGMAHIGVLRAMERAGLRPDYITGTSMGSIVGGLYSIGYNSHDLEKLVTHVDWDELLTNKIDLNQVAIEEKPYYGRFVIDLPMTNRFKIKLPAGLIEGQKLNEMLIDLTRGVDNIQNFHRFPIPFACVATNIATGKPVLLNRGNLAQSLRASMAIPGVFTPVVIRDTLLVDGGLVRNFPVQEAKDMGADILIGVFVSSDLENESQLDNFVSILMQSSWVLSAYDSREQKKLLNYYIQPDVSAYSTGSFSSSSEIIQKGIEAGDAFYPIFKKLADSLNAIGPQQPLRIPEVATRYRIAKISVEGNRKIPADLIQGKLAISDTALIGADAIENKITLLYGTGYFDNIGYELREMPDGYNLIVTVKETYPSKIKGAIHYDTENKAGIDLNYTLRNALLPNSRLVLDVDLAEYPRASVNYLKYVGRHQSFAAALDLNFDSFNPAVTSSNSDKTNIYSINQYSAKGSLFTSSFVNHRFGVEFDYRYVSLSPQAANDPLLTSLSYVRNSGLDAGLFFESNTFNTRYYPTHGSYVRGSLGYFFDGHGNYHFNLDSLSIKKHFSIASIARAEISGTKIFPVSHIFSVVATGGLTISGNPDSTALNVFGYSYFGGFRPRVRDSYSFYGARNYDYTATSYFLGKLDLQFEFTDHIFFTAGINYLNIHSPMNWFQSDYKPMGDLINNEPWRLGYGASIAYISLIGPISISATMDSRRQTVIGNFSLGFYF